MPHSKLNFLLSCPLPGGFVMRSGNGSLGLYFSFSSKHSEVELNYED